MQSEEENGELMFLLFDVHEIVHDGSGSHFITLATNISVVGIVKKFDPYSVSSVVVGYIDYPRQG